MADRWSNPSGSKGINRFRVWPSGTDSYDHGELTTNWDTLDAIIGIPSVGTWPATEGVDGGIYAEIKTAASAAIPIGAVYPWYRRSSGTATPDGWVICDGSSVTDHQFPGLAGQTITLPDLRGKFVMGADPDATIGAAGADVGSSNINAAAGAPGPGGAGGANSVTVTLAQLATHQHAGSTTGWSPQQETWYDSNGGKYPQSGNFTVDLWDDSHSIGTGAGGYHSGQHQHKLTGISAEGGGLAHENRPRWVGLIWIMKIKNPS